MTKVFRSISEPIRTGPTWEEMWKDKDNGLIISWETGRKKSLENPELAKKCLNNELPVLPWRGGLEKAIKGEKLGSLFYLAMWQGLRFEDLNIDSEQDVSLVCSRTNVKVVFTQHLLSLEAQNEE